MLNSILWSILLLKLHHHVIAPFVVLDVFDDAMVGFQLVPSLVAAGHGHRRFYDVAAAAVGVMGGNFYFLAGLNQALPFHCKFNRPHGAGPFPILILSPL